jgi:glycosyltransferase involved in cell wall biosynthesis
MIDTPKVSIVIPVYNGANYLSKAIESALAQTYQNIEIVVVNDGSSDDGKTQSIALSYGDKIRYFYKENGGVGSALNYAIKKMTGEYFSWLSHDDLYYPNKVATQINALSRMENRNTILYSDHASFFDDDEDTIKETILPAIPSDQFRYFITVNNSLNGCTLLIPLSAFLVCGTFDESLRTTQDYDLWFRLAEKFRFVHIPEVLVKSRQHMGQDSVRMKSTALIECNTLLTGFVNKLTVKEMTAATHKSISLSYLEIAESFLCRGFCAARQVAVSLAIKNLRVDSLRDAFKSLLLLFRAKLLAAIPTRVRAILTKILFRIKNV